MSGVDAGPGRDLSLVVPFFNPGHVIRETVERAAAALSAAGISFDIIAVSDGSSDGSEASLVDVLPGTLEVLRLDSNRGKGFAVRTGLAQAKGAVVGFIDGDGDIAPEMLPGFVTAALAGDGDIWLGSKPQPGSEVEVPWTRRIASSVYRRLVRRLFRLEVRDTQTGVKVMRAEVARAVVPQMREDRFVFDVELLVLAVRSGYPRFVELPVRLEKQYRSTVSVRSAVTILSDTLCLFWRLRVGAP